MINLPALVSKFSWTVGTFQANPDLYLITVFPIQSSRLNCFPYPTHFEERFPLRAEDGELI